MSSPEEEMDVSTKTGEKSKERLTDLKPQEKKSPKAGASDALSHTSVSSSWSLERPINLADLLELLNKKADRSDCHSCKSVSSSWSLERPINLADLRKLLRKKAERSDCLSCKSAASDWSLERPINLADLQQVLSAVSESDSGFSEHIHCEVPLHVMPSPCYAEAGDVACDLCGERKLKACKSCMTCLASFCETHVKDHYTVEALQRHPLVEVTKNLNMLLDNAQQKRIITRVQQENQTLKAKSQTLEKDSAALKQKISELRQKICELRLPDFICKGKTPAAPDLVLDPETAHCTLVLSDDGKRVRLGEKKTVGHNTERFDKYECVLTTESYMSGRHYWEVEVNKEFTIGVARESAQRKGKFNFSPSVGYWCLYHYRQSFTALEEPSRPLPIDAVPRVLGICIDVDEKWLTFYNSETKAHIYTFRQMDFADGEKIYPVFNTLEKSADLKIKTETNKF
ncbi:hypothetical protein MHYP_G00347490 [Metynnis hypsauchen]